MLTIAPTSSQDINAKRAFYRMVGGIQERLHGALIAFNNHVIYAGI
jgi:hypothetical protein